MIRYLGFTPVDCETIRNAREIEDILVQMFPYWKIPLIISSLIFGTYIIFYNFFGVFFCSTTRHKPSACCILDFCFSLVFYLAIWKIQYLRLDPRQINMEQIL